MAKESFQARLDKLKRNRAAQFLLSQQMPELPEVRVWESLGDLPSGYVVKLGRFPCVFFLVYIVLISIVLGAAWRPVRIDADLEQYRTVDATSCWNQAVYLDAARHLRPVVDPDGLGNRSTFTISLYYATKEGTAMQEASAYEIRELEHRLQSLPGWASLCNSSGEEAWFRCSPGESMMNFIWPERSYFTEGNFNHFEMQFNGKSEEMLPTEATLAVLDTNTASSMHVGAFVPESTIDAQYSRQLRSTFSFTAPEDEPWPDAYKQTFEEFVRTELYPELKQLSEESREEVQDGTIWDVKKRVKIFFSGDVLSRHEVADALEQDCRLAIGAMVLTWLLLMFFMRSVFLGTAALATVCLTMPLTHVLVVVPAIGPVSFVCIFLIVGLGTDVLVLSAELFRRSGKEWPDRRSVAYRLGVLFVAVGLKLLPEFLTALSFLVHLASAMRPMREFALFMGASMVVAGLLAVSVFVPLLLINESAFSPFIRKLYPKATRWVLEPVWARLPAQQVAKGLLAVAERGYGDDKAQRPGSIVLVVTGAVTFLLLFPTVLATALSSTGSVLELFPPQHQRREGRPVMEAFGPAEPSTVPFPPEMTACGPDYASLRQLDRGCALQWCEAPLAEEDVVLDANSSFDVDGYTCTCYGRRASTEEEQELASNCSTVDAWAYVSGYDGAAVHGTEFDLEGAWVSYLEAAYDATAMTSTLKRKELPSLVLEHWESGRTDVADLVELPAVSITREDGFDLLVDEDCSYQEMCHCGPRACAAPHGYEPSPVPLVATSRRLTDDTLGQASQEDAAAEVQGSWDGDLRIVFGVKRLEGDFLDSQAQWTWDSRFNPDSAGAQRAMVSICEDFHDSLRVHSASCWILAFRDWLQARGERFPTDRFRDFHTQLEAFLSSNPRWQSQIWLDQDGRMRATAFLVRIMRPSGATAEDILEERDRWNDYVSARNYVAATTAAHAWTTSQYWANAEAEEKALASAWSIAWLAVAATLVAGLIYVRDARFMGLVTLVTLAACANLSFIIFCILGWRLGPWEVLLLTVFFCYFVSPAFRMGREYFSPHVQELQGPRDAYELERESALSLEAGARGLLQEGSVHPDGVGELGQVPESSSQEAVEQEPPVPEIIVTPKASAAAAVGHTTATPSAAASSLAVPAQDEGEVAEGADAETSQLAATPAYSPGFAASAAQALGLPLDLTMTSSKRLADTGDISGIDKSEVVKDGMTLDIASVVCDEEKPDAADEMWHHKVRVQRSLLLVAESVMCMAIKTQLGGIFLAACQLRLFSRLGVVALLFPLLAAPCILLVLPAALLLFGPGGYERDLDVAARWAYKEAKGYCCS